MLRDFQRFWPTAVATLLIGLTLSEREADAQPAPADPPAEAPADPPADPPAEPPGATEPPPTDAVGEPPADAAPGEPPPAEGPPPDAPATEPAPAAPPGPPPPPVSLIPDGEAPPQRSMPPVFPPAIPSIDYGARLRVGLLFQNPEDPEKFNDVGQLLEGDIYMSGQVHRYWSWQFSLTFAYPGRAGTPNLATIMPLDVIGKFEPIPEFNIWAGRMLVQSDRFTPSGPWGIDEFFYPGFFPLVGPPALPKAGPVGRDVGTTVWGAPFGGHFKYYLGAYQLHDPSLSPLLSGRLQLSLLNPEPAFFQRTTYYGTKDLISVGVGAQKQTDGSVGPAAPPVAGMPATPPPVDDYSSITADLNVEKTFEGAGTLSLVGQYSKFEGDFQPWESYWVASLGYMLPQVIGFGKVRATLRYQNAQHPAPGADASNVLDAQLSYIVAAWYARLGLGFRKGNTWLAGDATAGTAARVQPSNMVYLGLTLADP